VKLRAVLRERRRETLAVKGKLARAKEKLRKTQVRGFRIAFFISILYEDVFWAILELGKPQFLLYFTFSGFFQKPPGGA